MEKSNFNLSNRVFGLLIIFMIALSTFWGFRIYEIYQNTTGSQPREVMVEAQGKAYVVPDVAQFNVGVTTKGQETSQIVEENTEKVNAIIASLKESGIDEKDIKTTQYSLYENYKWIPDEGSKQDGFILDQSVMVKVRETDKLGAIIDAASSKGATSIGSISFIVDDPDAAKDEARQQAIKKAKAKAESIAKEAGLELSEVTNYYEYSEGDYDGKPMYAEMATMDAADGGVSKSIAPSIQAGQQEVTLNVTLTYKIK